MVEVEDTRCPFTNDELNIFIYNLNLIPENLRSSRHMDNRKDIWIRALDICRQIKHI